MKNVHSMVKIIPDYKNWISSRWDFSYKRDDKGRII